MNGVITADNIAHSYGHNKFTHTQYGPIKLDCFKRL